MAFVINLDSNITDLINLIIPHTHILDIFFSFLSFNGSSIIIWFCILLFALIFEERKNPGIQNRDVAFVMIFLITISVSFISSELILKNITKRPRPCYSNIPSLTAAVKGGLTQCPKDYSFPSGHATTAFASVVVFTYFDKKRKWFYYLVATLIGISRIYLGYHYFLDVLIGGFLGYIISKIILFKMTDIT